MVKRLLSIIVFIAVLASFCSCEKSKKDESVSEAEPKASDTTAATTTEPEKEFSQMYSINHEVKIPKGWFKFKSEESNSVIYYNPKNDDVTITVLIDYPEKPYTKKELRYLATEFANDDGCEEFANDSTAIDGQYCAHVEYTDGDEYKSSYFVQKNDAAYYIVFSNPGDSRDEAFVEYENDIISSFVLKPENEE